MQDLREGDIWQKHITLFQNIINPLADASINPIPAGGGYFSYGALNTLH